MSFDDEVVDVGGVEGVEGLEGEVIQLLRNRSNWIYPDLGIIPMGIATRCRLGGAAPVGRADIGIIPVSS